MKEILQNLALIDLVNFCKENNIDCSGTHLVKNGRGFKYSLCRDSDGLAVATVSFHKSQVPTHTTTEVGKANRQLTGNDFFDIGAKEADRRKAERIAKASNQKRDADMLS